MKHISLLLLILFSLSACHIKDNRERIDELMTELCRKGDFNGTILVAEKGNIIYDTAFGFGNFITKEPLNDSSSFYLASVSKQFTAMAIMILKEQSKLSYDDTLTKYFPEFPAYANKITIRHLLTHTSGLVDYIRIDNLYKPDLNNEEVLKVLSTQKKLNFYPGDRFSYSNSGYVMLAMIVERVSGKPFNVFMKEFIFDPLGMKNTLVFDKSKPVIKNRAFGFNKNGNLDDYEILTAGDGGIYSTTHDLFLWDQSLYHNKLVDSSTLAEAFHETKLNRGSLSYYGFGWVIAREAKNKIVSHNGGMNGYRTMIYRDMKNHNSIIMLTNKGDAADVETITRRILQILKYSY
ncbi:MAG TPA: serine hydrolase domain-containing protein [Puia sp.]|jgi:CubicO group peptidase (beta-lactamase class C family)|nr:serine hydrolase domain-containing protein [Puia sp.]